MTAPGDPRVARLFEMTSDLLATISLEGRFTLLNPAWEQLLGWTREELLSNPIAAAGGPPAPGAARELHQPLPPP
jgi:PAS domain S-box-containing protein